MRKRFVADIWAGSPKLPLVLLPFSCLIFITTGTCMVEYFYWDVPLQQKIDLSTLYGPYLALCMFPNDCLVILAQDTNLCQF